jgi:hypothetical protein
MSLPAAVRAIGTRLVVALLVLLCPAALPGQAGRDQGEVGRTRVIVLGVEHAAQLVSEANQPGLLAAFLCPLDRWRWQVGVARGHAPSAGARGSAKIRQRRDLPAVRS